MLGEKQSTSLANKLASMEATGKITQRYPDLLTAGCVSGRAGTLRPLRQKAKVGVKRTPRAPASRKSSCATMNWCAECCARRRNCQAGWQLAGPDTPVGRAVRLPASTTQPMCSIAGHATCMC